MVLASGATVGHFRVLQQLGAGGMGIVYLAEDLQLGRQVAIKVLGAAHDPAAARRFLCEARAASALDHPNIAAIHEVFEHEGVPLIAMAYCPGETLEMRLARGLLPLPDVAAIGVQVSAALSAAHAAGIVHRDLKPANIMVGPDGHVRVLDFGLATVLDDDQQTASRLTAAGTTVGTVAYMAPEQVRGETIDQFADVWALGVVLYEMLTGVRPFGGTNVFAIMQDVLAGSPAPVRSRRSDVPSELSAILDLALQKDRARRTLTAQDVHTRLSAWQAAQSGGGVPVEPPRRSATRWRAALIAAAAVVVVATTVSAIAWQRRHERIAWARDVAIPQMQELAERDEFFEALDLGRQAERWLPGSAELAAAMQRVSRPIGIDSTPEGAEVRYRRYGRTDDAWRLLGSTPLRGAVIPRGLLEWEISKPGYATVHDVGLLPPYLTIAARAPEVPHAYVLERQDHVPRGMGRATPRGPQLLAIAGLEHIPPFELTDFWIDRFEVTNREYKAFVDAGGYGNRRFWTQPFVRDGRSLSWEDGMRLLRDRTGRPGPATWELGTYREGKDDEPVGGVSWYEAAAYAEYAGKQLPTIFHWSVAADRRATSGVLLRLGRYRADGPVPVGRSGAQSRFGTFDLAGNIKEWCWNEAGAGRRYVLGGGWNDPAYFFNDPDARSPWDREASFGFRCMKLPPGSTLPDASTRQIDFFFRDFSGERPVGDQVFSAYASLYSYDRGDLAPALESADDSLRDARVEIVTFNAAYGGERVKAYLLLPKRAAPPFQTLVYFPGINAIHQPSSRDGLMRAMDLVEYIVGSGRAMVIPVYKSTHERRDELTSDFPTTSAFFRDHVVMWSKDLQRTVDFLETRPDIDRGRIGFLGRSWGAAMGTIMVAMEPRLKLAIFQVGGFYFQHARPEAEAINFAPRVRVPSLMLNGRYDFFFPVDTSQRFMFQLLGTDEPHKRWVVYDTSHALPRTESMNETLAWLDKYFGPVPLQ
ncbi:MAG TPA: protein kinase [Vicinamibacterales bacterium]|nr:protein kinase [Vicinamibacterales bacterium]